MMHRFGWRMVGGIMGLLLASALQVHADTVYVGWDSDTGFSPVTVEIHSGDTLVWMDKDPYFSTYVTSDAPVGQPNYFQISLINEGDAYGLDFNSLGSFDYHDVYGNHGSVTVVATVVPEISLMTPEIAGNLLVFDATGLSAGKTNVLEVSTNLMDWTAIQTNVAENSAMSFTNALMAGNHYYRLHELP